MEFLLNRFRNLTVLLVIVLAQLLLLAYQVKGNQDIRLIRVWSVTAVTPIAKLLEVVRRNTIGVVEDYFVLINVREENRQLTDELGKMKMENHFLKSELQTAERARALSAFQARTPSRTIPARIIGTGTGANSRVVYVDQGASAGILRGMAVVTPEGIVGKVLDSYPTASQVLLITDPGFAAGVISQNNRVHGTVKGLGQSKCAIDYVENEEKVEVGEMFYTSGDDRIFPKGMPVGRATVVRQGRTFKEIYVVPTGLQNGVEEVLIVIQGEHQPIPQADSAVSGGVYLMKPADAPVKNSTLSEALVTDADRLKENYKTVGEAQGHRFGEGGPGSPPPNFNLRVEAPKSPPVTSPAAGAPGAGTSQAAPSQASPLTTPPKPKPVQVVGPDGQPVAVPPKPRPPVTIGPDGQPIPSRPKPATPTAGANTTETNPITPAKPKPATITEAPPSAGNPANPVVTPPKPKPIQLGPDGQPVASPPKSTTPAGTNSETNPIAPAKPKSSEAPPSTGNPANPVVTPPKPKPIQLGPDGQPIASPSKSTTPATGNSQTNPSSPAVTKPKPAPTKPPTTFDQAPSEAVPSAKPPAASQPAPANVKPAKPSTAKPKPSTADAPAVP